MRKLIRYHGAAAAVLAAAALFYVQPVQPQSEPAPKWSLIMVTTAKPDMRLDYEALQKQISAAYKKAEVPSRIVLQTSMGDVFEYVSISPLKRLGDLDGPGPLEKALGKDGTEALMRKAATMITSAHRLVSVAHDDLSIQSGEREPAPFAMVSFLRLVPGKGPEFENWMKSEYLPAMKKAEVKDYWVSQTVFGGSPNERVLVRPLKSIGELDAGPLTRKALGAEGARTLMTHMAGIVESTEYRIMKFRPDLSYQLAGAPAASQK